MTNALRLDATTQSLPNGGLSLTLGQTQLSLDPLASAVWQAADGTRSTKELLQVARSIDATATEATLFGLCDELADAGLLKTRLAPPTGAVRRRHVLMALAAGVVGLAMPAKAQSVNDVSDALPVDDDELDDVDDDGDDAEDTLEQLENLSMPEDELDDDFPEEGELLDGVARADQLPPLQGLVWDEQMAQGWVIEADAFVVDSESWNQAFLDEPAGQTQRESREKLLRKRRDLFRKQQAEALAKRTARRNMEQERKQIARRARTAQREEQVKARLERRQRNQEQDAKLTAKQSEERAKGLSSGQRQQEERQKLRVRQREAQVKARQTRDQANARRRQAVLRAREELKKKVAAQREELRSARARQREARVKAAQALAQKTAARRQEQEYKAEAHANADRALLVRKQESQLKASQRQTESAYKTK